MTVSANKQPLKDLRDEGLRVYERATAAGVSVRIAGGVAISMLCPSAGEPPLARTYADLDLVGVAREHKQLSQVLTAAGYQADETFNALYGTSRLFFWDPLNERQVDVFLNRVEMCHVIDLRSRLALPGPTLSLADLLVMKLQVVEANDKDLRDIITLLVDHEFTDSDDSGINLGYLCSITAGDWGLWRTVTMIALRADHYSRGLPAFAHQGRVHEQVQHFLSALEQVDKTRAWKLRARIGDRKRWYQLPEESH
jgi:hypothetical protein